MMLVLHLPTIAQPTYPLTVWSASVSPHLHCQYDFVFSIHSVPCLSCIPNPVLPLTFPFLPTYACTPSPIHRCQVPYSPPKLYMQLILTLTCIYAAPPPPSHSSIYCMSTVTLQFSPSHLHSLNTHKCTWLVFHEI